METYKLNVKCHNCGQEEEIEIPKGIEFGRETCSNCGCSTLYKKEKLNTKIPYPKNDIWLCSKS